MIKVETVEKKVAEERKLRLKEIKSLEEYMKYIRVRQLEIIKQQRWEVLGVIGETVERGMNRINEEVKEVAGRWENQYAVWDQNSYKINIEKNDRRVGE